MFEAGAEREARLALSAPISTTARHILGLREAAELPPERAREVLTAATRRYAAYQCKWMRRIPGIVRVRADRAAGEVAEEILAVARARRGAPSAASPSR
jgi:tRNA A37 N6-isopentenylltransferase MiaA